MFWSRCSKKDATVPFELYKDKDPEKLLKVENVFKLQKKRKTMKRIKY